MGNRKEIKQQLLKIQKEEQKKMQEYKADLTLDIRFLQSFI